MKSINTLVSDIEYFIESNEDWYEQTLDHFHLQSETRHNNSSNRREGQLRLSGLGDKCPRQLWYSVHHPELQEPLAAAVKFKYGYGHIIESMALSLARLAGHEVTGEQDELVFDGIVGHRDAVVDGCVVDVKSSSSIQFGKYKEGTLAQDDPFGYLYQLDGYVCGSADDPLVTVKDKGYILAIDKTLGHMALYAHEARPERIRSRIAYYKYVVERQEAPQCECRITQSRTTGGPVLDVQASYSAYKHICFPNLKTLMIKGRPYYIP